MRFLGGFFLSIFFIATFIFFHFLKTSTGTNQQVQFSLDESYYLEDIISKNNSQNSLCTLSERPAMLQKRHQLEKVFYFELKQIIDYCMNRTG